MRKFILKHEKKTLRLLEILPGFVSWNLILFPYWGILVVPTVVAYFILAFNIYWFYQSFQLAITATVSHFKIKASKEYDWVSDIKTFPDHKKVHHIIIVPVINEPNTVVSQTIDTLVKQTLPTKQITFVHAMEKREDKKSRDEKHKFLKSKYGHHFKNFILTVHPLLPGEAAGKASNEKHAALEIKKQLIDNGKVDMDYCVVTTADADTYFDKNYFATLTFKFLDDPQRYNRFWQAPIMYYNNIWELPALTRIPNSFGSIWNLSQLPRKDKLVNFSSYSLSFRLLHEAGYWYADKISEDWGIFFKAYYHRKGNLEVEPIYLPTHVDAPVSSTTWGTLKGQYSQYKRWAWGASDDSWIIRNYLTVQGVPFWDKTMRLIHVMWAHFLWPVNWFIITLGVSVPVLLNPAFSRTTLGYTVPKLSSAILTVSLIFLVIMLVFDNIYKPPRPKHVPRWRALLIPFEFILMPIAGFFFSALPGLDAHTRLMLGKYIEYKVTEKV